MAIVSLPGARLRTLPISVVVSEARKFAGSSIREPIAVKDAYEVTSLFRSRSFIEHHACFKTLQII
jgi:hypothetical protein